MTDWRTRAACRDGVDPELFFPLGDNAAARLQADEAKSVCARCPVVQQCLVWALRTGQEAGVWGGLTEEERRSLRRRAARAGVSVVAPVPPRAEGPAINLARARGARIARLIAAGEPPSAIARGLGLPITLVRQAHWLVASGAVEPNPESQTAGATS